MNTTIEYNGLTINARDDGIHIHARPTATKAKAERSDASKKEKSARKSKSHSSDKDKGHPVREKDVPPVPKVSLPVDSPPSLLLPIKRRHASKKDKQVVAE